MKTGNQAIQVFAVLLVAGLLTAFLVPFAAVGLTLWLFGKWAERVGNKAPPPDLVAAAKGKQK